MAAPSDPHFVGAFAFSEAATREAWNAAFAPLGHPNTVRAIVPGDKAGAGLCELDCAIWAGDLRYFGAQPPGLKPVPMSACHLSGLAEGARDGHASP